MKDIKKIILVNPNKNRKVVPAFHNISWGLIDESFYIDGNYKNENY